MPKKILVIDDELKVRDLVRNVLTILGGYQVVTAAGGEEGCRLAMEHKPDAIICDVDMPDFDGGDVAAFLKKTPETRGIPVIFLTGLATGTETSTGNAIGRNLYIAKPFENDDILKVIKSVLTVPPL